MLRVVLPVLSVALTVFALADCVQTPEDKVRGIPKWAWILLVVLLPWVGPITWLVAGKERADGGGGGHRQRREGPLAPDEDPDFLRKLDEDIRRERRERMRQEQERRKDDGEDGTPTER